jgi:hypothetical protein
MSYIFSCLPPVRLMVRRRVFSAVSNHGFHVAILRDAAKRPLLRMRTGEF